MPPFSLPYSEMVAVQDYRAPLAGLMLTNQSPRSFGLAIVLVDTFHIFPNTMFCIPASQCASLSRAQLGSSRTIFDSRYFQDLVSKS